MNASWEEVPYMDNNTATEQALRCEHVIVGANPEGAYLAGDEFGATAIVLADNWGEAWAEFITDLPESYTCDHGGEISAEQRWAEYSGEHDATCDCEPDENGRFVRTVYLWMRNLRGSVAATACDEYMRWNGEDDEPMIWYRQTDPLSAHVSIWGIPTDEDPQFLEDDEPIREVLNIGDAAMLVNDWGGRVWDDPDRDGEYSTICFRTGTGHLSTLFLSERCATCGEDGVCSRRFDQCPDTVGLVLHIANNI